MRIVGRAFLGVFGLLLAIAALAYMSGVLRDHSAPGEQLILDASEPWVESNSTTSPELEDAVGRSPDKALSVTSTLTIAAPDSLDNSSRAQLSVSITGPSDNPLLESVRQGHARGNGSALAWSVGAAVDVGLQFGEPQTSVSRNSTTVTMAATGNARTGRPTPVGIYPVFQHCSALKERTITVIGSGMTVSAVGTSPYPSSDSTGCAAGAWQEQTATRAVFRGTGAAQIELVPETAAVPGELDLRIPLFSADQQATGLLNTIRYPLLSSVPLMVAWLRLRRPRRTRTRAGLPVNPSLRHWSATDVLGARATEILRALLVLHVVVGAGLVLSVALSYLTETLFSSPDAGLYTVVSRPGAILPAAIMIAAAFVWRRLTLRSVAAVDSRSPIAGDIGWIVVASAAVLVLTGVLWPHALTQTTSGTERSFWDTWLGVLLIVIGMIHVAAFVGFLAARCSGATPKTQGRLAWAAALLTAIGFLLLVDQAALWLPWGDWPAPPTFTGWLLAEPGVLTMVFVGLGYLILLLILLALTRGPNPRIGRGGRLLWWSVLAFLSFWFLGMVCQTLMLGAPRLVDQDTWLWWATEPSWSERYRGRFGHLVALYLAMLIAAFGVNVLGRALRLRPRDRITMVAGVALTSLLLLVEPIAARGGLLGTVTGAAVPLTAAVFVWLTLDRITRHALEAAPPQTWLSREPFLRRWRGLRVVVALLLSVPLVVYGGEWAPPFSWYDFSSFASSVDSSLPTFALAVLLLLMRHLGSTAQDGALRGTPAVIRTVAVLVAVVGILSPSVSTAGFPIAFAIGWALVEVWLLPRSAAGTERAATGEAAEESAKIAVRAVVRDAVTARTEAALEKDLRQKLTEEAPAEETHNRRLDRITELALGEHRLSPEQRRWAFSSYGGGTAWQNARQFAVAGFVIGLPWTVLDVAAVIGTLTGGGPYRLVDAATGLLVILRFAIAGLVVGGAYPLIRGTTGLAKGFSLFIAMSGPALCLTLLPDPRARDALASAALQLAQWLSFGLLLGLVADWRILRRHGYGLRHLRELHRMNALTASASTLLLAVLTAAATAVGTGAAGVLVERALTPPPSAPVPTAPVSQGASTGSR